MAINWGPWPPLHSYRQSQAYLDIKYFSRTSGTHIWHNVGAYCNRVSCCCVLALYPSAFRIKRGTHTLVNPTFQLSVEDTALLFEVSLELVDFATQRCFMTHFPWFSRSCWQGCRWKVRNTPCCFQMRSWPPWAAWRSSKSSARTWCQRSCLTSVAWQRSSPAARSLWTGRTLRGLCWRWCTLLRLWLASVMSSRDKRGRMQWSSYSELFKRTWIPCEEDSAPSPAHGHTFPFIWRLNHLLCLHIQAFRLEQWFQVVVKPHNPRVLRAFP